MTGSSMRALGAFMGAHLTRICGPMNGVGSMSTLIREHRFCRTRIPSNILVLATTISMRGGHLRCRVTN